MGKLASLLPGRGRVAGLSILARLAIGFGLVLAIVVVSSALTRWSLSQLRSDDAQAQQRYAYLLAINEFQGIFLQQNAALESYLLTDNASLKEAFQTGDAASRWKLDSLASGYGVALGVTPFLEDVRKLFAEWRRQADTDLKAVILREDTRVARQFVLTAISSHIETQKEIQQGLAARKAASMDIVGTVGLIGSILSGLTALAACFWLLRGLQQPLLSLSQAMDTLAAGQLDVVVPGAARQDEIGMMARSLEVFRENMQARQEAARREEADNVEKHSRHVAIEGLIAQFRSAVSSLLSAVSEQADKTRSSAETLSNTTSMAQEQTSEVVAASHQISISAAHVASAMEEMANSVFEIAKQTEATFAKVDAMAKAALHTEMTIKSLSSAAEQIGSVTGMIKAVADQTNLLSLNATIEAARAGNAGRGFAVVAQEVKELSSQTTSATEEISQLVEKMQTETKAAVFSIGDMAKLAADAQLATAAISAAIQQQQAVSSEIVRSVNQTSQGSSVLSRNIEGVSGVIRETNDSASLALRASEVLSGTAIDLRRTVDGFLENPALR